MRNKRYKTVDDALKAAGFAEAERLDHGIWAGEKAYRYIADGKRISLFKNREGVRIGAIK